MSKLIKGIVLFSLGFVLSIAFCFVIGFSKYKPYINSSSLASADTARAVSALYALGEVAEKITGENAPLTVQYEDISVNQQVSKKQLAMQERERCKSAELYRKNNPINDLNYIGLLKDLNPKYCGENTKKDVAAALADFSLRQTPSFRRHVSFDTTLLRIFREFAEEDARVAKALANFYVVLAHDALQNDFTKLSVSFLETSIQIRPNLPAQQRMSALLGSAMYNNNPNYDFARSSNTPIYSTQTAQTSGGASRTGSTSRTGSGILYLIMFFLIVIFPAFIYWVHYRRMNSMDIDVRMKRYDFPDDLQTTSYTLGETKSDAESSDVHTEIEITTDNEPSHKVINLYKEKGNSSK